MEVRKHDVVVVGSGAGGATVARELSRAGKNVLVVERGEDTFPLPLSIATSKEGIDIYQAFGAGGATVLCNGNGVRALEQDLAGLGIDLEREYGELEAELRIAPIAESLLSENGSLKLLEMLRTSGNPYETDAEIHRSRQVRRLRHVLARLPERGEMERQGVHRRRSVARREHRLQHHRGESVDRKPPGRGGRSERAWQEKGGSTPMWSFSPPAA